MRAPIVLFVYNRPWHTRQCLESLRRNSLADESVLYIYADGAREHASTEELGRIEEVKQLVRERNWCKETHVIISEKNKGIGGSVVDGVSDIINRYGKIIVLEDDLVLSEGFLKYMNDALDMYEEETEVMHISGYMFPVKAKLPPTYFYNATSCWGWGTWARAWKYFSTDSESTWKELVAKNLVSEFTIDDTMDFKKILLQNAAAEKGERSLQFSRASVKWNWDVTWHASVCARRGYSLHPYPSLVRNIGHDETGVHCKEGWWSKIYKNQLIADAIEVKKIPVEINSSAWKATKEFNQTKPGWWIKIKEKALADLTGKAIKREYSFFRVVPAPIVFFVYNRPEHTRKTLDKLALNELAGQSTLFIFSDGPKENASAEELAHIDQVRKIIHNERRFKEVNVIESPVNKGLAASVISGITQVVNEFGKIIVVEDDILTDKYFLKYCNEALDYYENESRVMNISGFTLPASHRLPSTFFLPIPSCWGWATWKDRWKYFNPDSTSLLNEINMQNKSIDFNFNNSYDHYGQLQSQVAGKINSWAIRWYASIFLNEGLSLYPSKSLTQNIGMDGTGTHYKGEYYNKGGAEVKISKGHSPGVFYFTPVIATDKKINIRVQKYLRNIYSENILDKVKRLIRMIVLKRVKVRV